MAESIQLHFRETAKTDVFAFLRGRCESPPDRPVFYYPNRDYLLIISEYADYDVECGPDEKARIESLLGTQRTFSLDVELRRSVQNSACDAAQKLVSELKARHDVAIDDGQQIWSSAKFERNPEFLRIYRT